MSQFFKSKNNQNKYYIYLLTSKPYIQNDVQNKSDNYQIKIKVIVSKHLILQDLSYIVNNYNLILENELENKIIEHYDLIYNLNQNVPRYPYDFFFMNRILLHSFLYICKNIKTIEDIILKEKVNIISNSNYLKRIKDWSENWRKNRYSIDKYQNISSEVTSDSLFSINTLSEYYFNIVNCENQDNKYKIIFNCISMKQEEKSMFERTLERPNTDLIEQCHLYFENDKQIRFM
jgi:hypothetical protein